MEWKIKPLYIFLISRMKEIINNGEIIRIR